MLQVTNFVLLVVIIMEINSNSHVQHETTKIDNSKTNDDDTGFHVGNRGSAGIGITMDNHDLMIDISSNHIINDKNYENASQNNDNSDDDHSNNNAKNQKAIQ